ncbi:peptidylprolyl isomerase [Polaribacter sp. HL-MS24]|uniref:peptidylprolyl isomerase n=1 Tax=Polaribacter sp. HL-MS24 TaxID=3077735 RepID=UPI002934E0E4|nr:peptidylprolyl isomerase [Polaribacter sp. HL-MS24]WOC39909.1 peptidylprolyl isomerase [Polaribacter sp. HL-MS24]
MKKIIVVSMLLMHTFVFSQTKSKTLVTINDEKISVADFKQVYEKNLNVIESEASKDIANNLDLFINFKLKVKEAYAIKLDTLPSYKKEIEMYRNQLSAPYLQDKSLIEKLLSDAYYRTKNEIKAKHILIRSAMDASPADTLAAYQKIVEIRNRIMAGEDFETVAEETSEDESARDNLQRKYRGNRGNLGYFSAFRMVYPFENTAYNTKIGEISMPFKTRFGYHIVKVDSIRPSKGEVEVAHILVTDTTQVGKAKIEEAYAKLNANESFESLAKEYSNDTSSKGNGGRLNKFGSGRMVPPFDKAAFSLKREGEFSAPFRTRFGWHIIQLIKKHPVKSFEEMKAELTTRLKNSGTMKLSDEAVLNKLKNTYQIEVNESSKAIFKRKEIRSIPKDSLQNILLQINEKKFTQEDFVTSIQNKKNTPINVLFEAYKDQEILRYFKENLVHTQPEYANTLKEYEDGLLLFELMKEKVWEKSTKDTLGLKEFFIKNKKNYSEDDLTKIKGQVINDYQNLLEQNWISDLRKKNQVIVNKKQLKKLIQFYEKN